MSSFIDLPKNTEIEKKLFNLFRDFDESLIWSCLQGVMGEIITSNEHDSAIAYLGDFAYFAGKAEFSVLDKFNKICSRDEMILVPLSIDWEQAISEFFDNTIKSIRYAIKKEKADFELNKLTDIVSSLDKEFIIKQIDNSIYNKCLENDWSADFVSNYADFEQFSEIGLGYVILNGDKLVSGASSYSSFNGGIEVEITTHPQYRKLGLATVCAAKLILECCKRNLYPSWDARNMTSVRIAEKLGYRFDKEYTVYITKLR